MSRGRGLIADDVLRACSRALRLPSTAHTGDLDLVLGYHGTLGVYENSGSGDWGSPQTGAGGFMPVAVAMSNPTYSLAFPVLVDLDHDHDLDLVVGGSNQIYHYENTGTATAPNFVLRLAKTNSATQTDNGSPFSAVAPSERMHPSFVDMDGDGDLGEITHA